MSELTVEQKSELCLKCRKCCEYLSMTFSYSGGTEDTMKQIEEFYVTFGCEVCKSDNYFTVLIPHRCNHIDKDKGCLIYNERPKICMNMQGDRDLGFKGICLWNHVEP